MPKPYAQEIYRDLLVSLVSEETVWLDLGCGKELIRSWLPGAVEQQRTFKRSCRRLVGIDAVDSDVKANPYLQEAVVGNLNEMPFRNGEFNLLTANMVLEHIEFPKEFLAECHRVLAPGGCFLFLTPNIRHWMVRAASLTPDWLKRPIVRWMDGREDADIFPTHYRLNSVPVCRALVEQAGFEIRRLEMVDAPPIRYKFPVPNIDIVGLIAVDSDVRRGKE